MSLRRDVLNLYKRIVRLTKRWKDVTADIENVAKEQSYMMHEARTLFHKNKEVCCSLVIK